MGNTVPAHRCEKYYAEQKMVLHGVISSTDERSIFIKISDKLF